MPSRPSKSILIVGGDSRIAGALACLHKQHGDTVTRTTRRNSEPHRPHLDLSRPETFDALDGNYDVAYLCASVTSRQACENDPIGTARLNVDAPKEILKRLSAQGVFSVIFSTNVVFDGDTPDVPVSEKVSPKCHYGEQKVALERLLTEGQVSGAVVRVGKMLDGNQPNFESWRQDLLSGNTISPFFDMVFAPLWITQVAEAVTTIGSRKKDGIYHFSAKSDLSYAEAALHLARSLNVDTSLVRPKSAKSVLPPSFHNPCHTTLQPAAWPRFSRPDPREAIDALCAAYASPQRTKSEVVS